MEKNYQQIKTYLDNSFAALPQNEETLRIKNEIYCSMLDKFNSLVQDGANEYEALGKVVGEFGSLNEIRTALGIDGNAAAMESAPVNPERTKRYSRYKIKQGILIAVGVVLCIIAVFMYPWYAEFSADSAVGNAIFGLLIAAGVFLFVFAGTSEAKYFDVANPVKYAIPPTAERMNKYQKFLTARSWLISLSISLFIISVFVMPCFAGLAMDFIMPSTIVAAGVAILIIVGSIHSTYKDVSGRR